MWEARIIDLKTKYAWNEEKVARRQYRETKAEVARLYQQTEGRKRKFKRLIERIAKENQEKWKSSLDKHKKRVKWWKQR